MLLDLDEKYRGLWISSAICKLGGKLLEVVKTIWIMVEWQPEIRGQIQHTISHYRVQFK